MKHILIILIAALILAMAMAVAGTPMAGPEPTENHCHDPASWPEWEEIIDKNAHDQDLLGLYGLRIGLCMLVERGTMSVDQATEIFERQRERLVLERSREERPETDRRL